MTVYPGAIPLDINILQPQRNMEIAIGFMLRAAFGTSTVADGLACIPTSPASMSVTVGPGSILVLTTVDTLAAGFGSLALDNADSLMKIGVNLTSTSLGPFTAPTTAGQSQAFLVEAAFSETDGTPIVLPYYNATNPLIPYSGPANTGAAQNTVRSQRVALQVKAGVAATTGSQVTPSPDIGWIGLWVITIANGNTTLTAGNITSFASAPFIPAKLGVGSLFGFSHQQVFTASGTFTVPAGVTTLKVICTAGGGGGSPANNGPPASGTTDTSGGGGGAGGTSIKICAVAPGQAVTVTVGSGGASSGNGTPSSFGAFCSASAGTGSGFISVGVSPGGNPGVGSGGDMNLSGGYGSDGQASIAASFGNGGASYWGGGSRAYAAGNSPTPVAAPGSGGGGCYNGVGNGSLGANGIVVVQW